MAVVNLPEAMRDLLVSDSSVTGKLAPYNGKPAVFTTPVAPAAAQLPYILTGGVTDTPARLSKQDVGREIEWDIRCYAKDTGSVVAIEALKEAVRALVDGGGQPNLMPLHVVLFEVSLVIPADEPERFGRVITTRLVLGA